MSHETSTTGVTDAQPSPPVALPAFSEGRGPVLVMLGGGTTGAAGLASHAQELARDFCVVRLQTLNIDRAQRKLPLPSGYSIKTESNAMLRALDQLGLTGPLDIAGHSLGALVALDFALDYPERVRTLALSEPPAFWVVPADELHASSEMRKMAELVRQFGPVDEPGDQQLVTFLRALGDTEAKPPPRSAPEWDEWVARRACLRGLSAIPNHTDTVARLKTFHRPVLIITGKDSPTFHRRINDILAATLPMVERAELRGSHSAVSSGRDEFLVRLRSFLARHENTADS